MINNKENNSSDKPNVYEIEQIIWDDGRGKKSIIYVEAYSISEAIILLNDKNAINNLVSIKKLGEISARSKIIFQENIVPFHDVHIKEKNEYISSNDVRCRPDRVRVVADMPIYTLKEIEKHLLKS